MQYASFEANLLQTTEINYGWVHDWIGFFTKHLLGNGNVYWCNLKGYKMTKEKIKSMQNMGLHEQYIIKKSTNVGLAVTRVPGGWIYTNIAREVMTDTLVPLCSEFSDIEIK